ncbi:hypothetical protein MKX03_020745 [Papaver bracteatum]|nr:hypothetical protein MKX03_020745 [Papaver bracteatum]
MRNTTEIKRSDSVSSSSSSSSPSRKNSLSPKSTLARLRRKLSSKRVDERDVPTYTRDLERFFRYFDENGDGKISAAELESCVKAMGGDFTSDEAKRAVESTDSDGDGLLEFNDFVKLMEVSGEEEKTNDLKEAFRILKRMLTRLGESKTTEECRTKIRLFDLNGDGVLSFDEFSAMMV